MNKVIEKLKNLFYDNTDYVIIILIVVVVSGTIAWRLNSLFDKGNNTKKTEAVSEINPSNYRNIQL